MNYQTDTVFDIVTMALVLMLGLPVFIFCYNTLLYDTNFGFGTLSDKSVMATSAQTRDLYSEVANMYPHLDNLKLYTKAHIMMAPAVDDKIQSNFRTIYLEDDSYSYNLSQESKLARGALIESVCSSMLIDGSETVPAYHLNISLDGSLSLNIERSGVD